MSLIQCPECNNQVSNMAKICPHCKYQIISLESKPCPECGNITANEVCEDCGFPIYTHFNKTKNFFSKKRMIIWGGILGSLLIGIILLAVIVSNIASIYAEKKYKENLYEATALMSEGAEEAEQMCYLIRNVWHNSIHQKSDAVTDKYTKINGKFNEDFNDSLTALYSDSEVNKRIGYMLENRAKVNAIMGKLLSPPEKYQEEYSEIEELYERYLVLADLAITVNGSYNSFTEDTAIAISDFSYTWQRVQRYIQ